MAPIILLTDFGAKDGFTGVMKGVIYSINPDAKLIDLSHDIPPQDLGSAAFVLWNSYRFFPKGSIFVSVVDPGVGSERAILAIETDDYYFLAPDNGLMDLVFSDIRPKHILRIENPSVMLPQTSQTFHGRDIFAPTAAHLSMGFPFTQLGPIHSYRLRQGPFIDLTQKGTYEGSILHIDHFGNLITNFRLSPDLQNEPITLETGAQMIHGLSESYTTVSEGNLLVIEGSHGLLEIAVRNGNAAKRLQVGPHSVVKLNIDL